MNDTVNLLQSCHRGTITAVNSLEQVMEHVQSGELQQRLQSTLARHKTLGEEIGQHLQQQHEQPKEPGAMARMGVWMTTEMRMMGDDSQRDHQIARLIINGCNTGIQELSEDLNRFAGASGDSRRLADSLVIEEQHLMEDLRAYL